MTYDDAIAFWYGRINFEVRSASPKDLKLERMRALLRLLGDPHERVRTVHITGTKGKGSTAAMIAAVLQAAGYRVGLFTSPHLERVDERIQVNGEPISPGEMAVHMERIVAAAASLEGGAALTFFEISTALGFLHFVHRRCEFAVVEVGLGGRFDSTNVCHPLVSVITTVGLDHTAQLGNTLEEIAYQKAGIIKRGVPVVCGVTQPGPSDVILKAAVEVGAEIIQTGQKSSAAARLGLLGRHQQSNAALAVAVIDQLRRTGVPIPDAAVARGLAEVRWPARIEVIRRNPTVILDTAHNVPSVEALVETLREFVPAAGRKAVVFAVSSDKQYAEMVRILAGYFDEFHLTRYDNSRCVPPEKLAAFLEGKQVHTHHTSAAAWAAARSAATPHDLVCVTGSVFLAGELQPLVRAG
ncbi:MAG: folylpolyglutamate synthase/dihydrofolate synthase family protein [Gemmataceae bacterium]